MVAGGGGGTLICSVIGTSSSSSSSTFNASYPYPLRSYVFHSIAIHVKSKIDDKPIIKYKLLFLDKSAFSFFLAAWRV